jgi:glutamine amidotransferase
VAAPRVRIVDYGVGNLKSIERAFSALGAEACLCAVEQEIRDAGHLVLPGVGAFGDCMAALRERRLEHAVVDHARSGKPLLGICVGMQMMFEVGEEFGEHAGLGLLSGRVVAIPATRSDGPAHKIPHVGWTPLSRPREATAERWGDTILHGIEEGVSVYFVHSFTAQPTACDDRLADADYGGRRIAAAVARDNICGTQFHPEKSGPVGLRMIGNFLSL